MTEKTTFAFEHRVFSLEGSYFDLDKSNRARFHMPLGDMMAAVEISTLYDEFKIDRESPDGQLLQIVTDSLRFVRQIRVNDAIPTEILDGTASWSVQDSHAQIAEARVTAQLITWLTGREEIIHDLGVLMKIVEDPENKEKLQTAFTDIAKRLKLGPEGKDQVVANINQFGHELSYIQALKDHFDELAKIGGKIKRAQGALHGDRASLDELGRVEALFTPALNKVEMQFEQLEASTCEILSVLARFDTHIELVRDARDDLHNQFLIWQELIGIWDEVPARALDERSNELHRAIKRSYQFLAQNFTQAQSWAIAAN